MPDSVWPYEPSLAPKGCPSGLVSNLVMWPSGVKRCPSNGHMLHAGRGSFGVAMLLCC